MIPDFQKIMRPFLNIISDGLEHTTSETNEKIAAHFKLSEEELNQYLPSGVAKTFPNRVAWAKSYFKMAGLLENTKRSSFKITEAGKQFLKDNPTEITIKILKTLPAFLERTGRSKDEGISVDIDNTQSDATPEEILESSYLTIRKNLSQELLLKVKSCTPSFFESLVVELLVKMGYGGSIQDAGRSIGRSGDEGIDGIIKEDRLGLDVIYIQAKRWEGVVGRPEIQKFIGALAGQGAKKGVFITTSRFTNEAKEYHPKNDTKIVLIDGEQLTDLMIDFNLAVSKVNTFEIKRIDNDYFGEE
ncbi:restriction endonuclease [uncultured Cytophaga sp.]|uniref:restriction endonuclease n=1 Tax=uncultured Cytophaga sp. TaxID=160238 RepID=UPI0026171117|nr:restriction endonuclease [uncultured Cytophaga sp.]